VVTTARTAARPDWTIEIHDGRVRVLRRGAWYSDADDLDDAIGMLRSQRATTVAINEDGYQTTRRL